ncbi:ABC transporter ATP-binding protein [Adhaeribacter aquaticus]|uniref:ABC transporter ATP-binding protein n=1 Tax=Adhaeribacter aquaticus TaxID=299567 RepID=UPI000407ED77|nr:ABC transporter ATP-binding protein [Adhaeribacter aquaticus]
MDLLEVAGLSIEEEGKFVLKNINFTQQAFQKVAIAGETGSGKSTLLKTIAGLIQPDAGLIKFAGKKVKGPQDQLIPGHPGVAYLSQQFELPKFLRVEQALRYANTLPGEEAEMLYSVCRINHLLKRRTDHLSGGETQRIALARLLLTAPKLLMLDEPFSNLDMTHKQILKSVIRDITEELEISLILISHDPLDSLSWADQIMVMHDGQIIQKGTPKEIYQQPATTYIAGLFGNYNLLTPEQSKIITQFLNVEESYKNMVIRPEDLKFATGTEPGIPGKVTQVNYYGSFYEIEITLNGTCILARTNQNYFKVNDSVNITLAKEAVWYV